MCTNLCNSCGSLWDSVTPVLATRTRILLSSASPTCFSLSSFDSTCTPRLGDSQRKRVAYRKRIKTIARTRFTTLHTYTIKCKCSLIKCINHSIPSSPSRTSLFGYPVATTVQPRPLMLPFLSQLALDYSVIIPTTI